MAEMVVGAVIMAFGVVLGAALTTMKKKDED
jgi:hypothetical protein